MTAARLVIVPAMAAPTSARPPAALPAVGEGAAGEASTAPERPAWVRPALAGVLLLAAVLMFADVTVSGYGNDYYAVGAQAAGRSWRALFLDAADLGEYVSLDKGPLPDWLMGLSVRIFGFGSLALMIPGAIYATAAVGILYDAVRRVWGYPVGIGAALLLALTPVAVLVGRFNTPDALLMLLLVASAWAATRALLSGALRDGALAGVLLGLAFNTKMLEAYVILPALFAALALGVRGALGRRAALLGAFTGSLVATSLAWYGLMMLLSTGDRPYVAESRNNSWLQLIFEGNGVSRVNGNGGFASGLESRLLSLFSHHVGGQIAWLLPLALAGVIVGALQARRAGIGSPQLGAVLIWGGWGITGFLLLSLASGTIHAYYTSLLAPPAAALAALALVRLWEAARTSAAAAIALAALLLFTGTLAYVLLAHVSSYLPWLRWLCFLAGAAAALLVVLPHLFGSGGRAFARVALPLAVIAVIAAPAAYSIATAGRAHTGSDPVAGPAAGEESSYPGGPQAHARVAMAASLLPAITRWMEARREGRRFLAAVTDARTADPVALMSGLPVITVGGYQGGDPAPTVAQLRALVRSRRLRFILLDAQREWSFGAGRISARGLLALGCSHVPLAQVDPALTPQRLRALKGQPLALVDCAGARGV